MKGALDLNQFDLADSVLESILDNHNTARFVLDDPTVHRFHRMFWTKAAELYQSTNTKNAIKLYMYSLSLPTDILPSSDLENLQANIAWCHLKENHLSDAQVSDMMMHLAPQFRLDLKYIDTATNVITTHLM